MENERKQALSQLHLDFFKELQETGLGFHPELRGIINANSISLGIVNPKEPGSLHWVEFASDVTIYVAEKNIVRDSPAEISVSGAGAFSPNVAPSYWKTIHAAIILQNWDLIQGICSKYCARYVAEFQR